MYNVHIIYIIYRDILECVCMYIVHNLLWKRAKYTAFFAFSLGAHWSLINLLHYYVVSELKVSPDRYTEILVRVVLRAYSRKHISSRFKSSTL